MNRLRLETPPAIVTVRSAYRPDPNPPVDWLRVAVWVGGIAGGWGALALVARLIHDACCWRIH